jgi:BirA family biotin operon repressor/biotin-[acetyl-CoA-carboxylase] ligase
MPILSDDPSLISLLNSSASAGGSEKPAGFPHVRVLREHFFEGIAPYFSAVPAERWWVLRRDAPRSQYGAILVALASGGASALPDGLATLALTGSRFRGQRGRAWVALEGNLHLCVHHHLTNGKVDWQAALSVLPAIAAAEAIEAIGGRQVGFKWVNDLVVEGSKVGGVLSTLQWRDGVAQALSCGIGINLRQAPSLAEDVAALPAASLGQFTPIFSDSSALWRLAQGVVDRMGANLARLRVDGPNALLAGYRQRAIFLGREVTILPVEPGKHVPIARGRVLALRDDLSLELAGVREPIRHGRMWLRET